MSKNYKKKIKKERKTEQSRKIMLDTNRKLEGRKSERKRGND